MKYSLFKKKCQGIGLIEILVTSVVVGLGLLGVASLQGDLIGDSRNNKTRAECQALANTKIEQLRDTIEKTGTTGYNALASSISNESIVGVTETFTRNWVVTDQTNPIRKQVSVTVNWGVGTENSCTVQSIITFDSIGSSEMASEGGGISGLVAPIGGSSLNAKSSDEITKTITLASAQTAGSVVTVDGKTYIVNARIDGGGTNTKASGASLCSAYTPFENDLFTHRVDNDGVSGNEAIELYEKVMVGTVEYCIPRIRYNGGVINPIRGIVHSGATASGQTLLDVNLFTFNASESGTFCVFKPAANAKSAPYVCYVGGNCQGFTGIPLSDSVTECQNGLSASIVGLGGWRGKVGLLGVAPNGRNVCFAEELASAPETLDTARNYYTRKAGLNEGINKPYSCHDFLIINGKTTEAKVHNECVIQANAIGGLKLASKTIQRDVIGDNFFDPVIDTSFCVGTTGTAYTITGSITGAGALPIIMVADGILTNPCVATTSSYTCNIITSGTSVTISGIYSNQPISCNLMLSSTTPTVTGCSIIFTTLPTYTITGHIITTLSAAADAISLTLLDGSNTVNCSNNKDYNNTYSTYTCLLSTASTVGITINATAANGYAVLPVSYEVPTLSGGTSSFDVPTPGNDFVASVAQTYTISGKISLDANVDNLTSLTTAVNTGTGSCTLPTPNGGWKKSTNYNYTCSVLSGSNSLSAAISPTCSNTKNAFKKYTLSTTGLSTTGSGQLVIDLGTVTGNQTHDISISESTTPC